MKSRLFLRLALALAIATFASLAFGSIVVTAATDRTTYLPMEPILVSVTAANPDNADVTLNFGSSFQANYWMDGKYDWSADKFFLTVLTAVTIPAHQSHTWTIEHNHYELDRYAPQPGDHSIIGSVVGYGASQPYNFRVVAGTPGDANVDGMIDTADLASVLTAYGNTHATWRQGDFNADAKVDIDDLVKVLTSYNRSVGLSAGGPPAAVPEPAAVILLLPILALVARAICRTRRG